MMEVKYAAQTDKGTQYTQCEILYYTGDEYKIKYVCPISGTMELRWVPEDKLQFLDEEDYLLTEE